MTTKKFSQAKMGRNPFAPKQAAPASETAKEGGRTGAREQSEQRIPQPESGLFQKLMIELPIRLVFVGLKSLSLLREVMRTATFRA